MQRRIFANQSLSFTRLAANAFRSVSSKKPKVRLTQKDFLSWRRCPKKFYLDYFIPDKIKPDDEARMDALNSKVAARSARAWHGQIFGFKEDLNPCKLNAGSFSEKVKATENKIEEYFEKPKGFQDSVPLIIHNATFSCSFEVPGKPPIELGAHVDILHYISCSALTRCRNPYYCAAGWHATQTKAWTEPSEDSDKLVQLRDEFEFLRLFFSQPTVKQFLRLEEDSMGFSVVYINRDAVGPIDADGVPPEELFKLTDFTNGMPPPDTMKKVHKLPKSKPAKEDLISMGHWVQESERTAPESPVFLLGKEKDHGDHHSVCGKHCNAPRTCVFRTENFCLPPSPPLCDPDPQKFNVFSTPVLRLEKKAALWNAGYRRSAAEVLLSPHVSMSPDARKVLIKELKDRPELGKALRALPLPSSIEEPAGSTVTLGAQTVRYMLSTLLGVASKNPNEGYFIVREEIERFIDSLEYPVYCLDFETVAFTVPPFQSLRPYQQLPFQYSLDVFKHDILTETPVHHEFLGFPPNHYKDPRQALADSLLEKFTLDPSGNIVGCVLAHNASFESRVLRELAGVVSPQASEKLRKFFLLASREIFRDTLPLARSAVMHRSLEGSFSMKALVKVLLPELNYGSLNIRNGANASRVYLESYYEQEAGDWEQVRADLLKYCGRDTESLYELVRKLHQLAKL